VATLLTIIHVIICLVLMVAVLLQSGKAADLAGAFGGVGSQTAFGPRGTASLLSKVTTICAVLFMFTSLGLWSISGRGARSALSREKAPASKPAAAETKKEPTGQTPAQSAPGVGQKEDKKEAAGKTAETKAGDAKKQDTPAQKPTGQETKK
jgi:preprotein translocase subunit SecG